MNDDVEEVRRMLTSANPSPRGELAGSSRDVAGRAAFARVTASLTSPPRRVHPGRVARAGLRVGVVGALAVTVAGGVTVAQNLGGVQQGKPRSIIPGVPAGQVANAQVVLAKAADSVGTRAFVAPRPDQWVYSETHLTSPGTPAFGSVQTSRSPLKTKIDRSWLRADGVRVARYQNGRLQTAGLAGDGPFGYAALAALPRDPKALLAWARRQTTPASSPDDSAATALSGILSGDMVLPPSLESATYQAMAMIPGVTLNHDAADVEGRPALAVTYVTDGWISDEILLDRATYAYLGWRSMAIKDNTERIPTQRYTGKSGTKQVIPGGTFTTKKGTILTLNLRVHLTVVDRPGQQS